MAKAMSDEEDRSGEAAAGRIPDEIMKVARLSPKKIQAILEEFFPNPEIPLAHTSPYTLLIAVLLSARSRDDRVNKITPLLFSLADTPEKMVLLSQKEIQDIIRPCGLSPQKAKAILGLSQRLLKDYQGQVPKTFQDLESLPGVGHKTASVVMGQAFSIPAFPVDTHIQRCAVRWGLSKGRSPQKIEKDLKALFPKKYWGKLHLQIIYFGRAYCQALKHDPKQCPICSRRII